jgi:hypothetical protein
MLTMANSRSGHKIVSINGVSLHSSYNPESEAFRFVSKVFDNKSPGKIVLLGAELGYLSQAIKERFPRIPLICVYYSAAIYKQSFLKGDLNWHPELNISIDDFFYKNISELDIEGMEYIEWSPSGFLFKEIAKYINNSLTQVLREKSGSLFTTMGAGKRWVKNSIINFLSFDRPLGGNPCPDELPVVILASGPSLEQSCSILRRYKHKFRIWALPSALSYCQEYELIPDLVIVTDPGYYAAYHFHSSGFSGLTVAMPFSASRGLWQRKSNVFPFLQPNFFEESLIKKTKVSLPYIPVNGTVAGSALLLALKFTNEPIIMAGLDFCYKDIFPYARPNASDNLIYFASQRFFPYSSGLYLRALAGAPIKIKNGSARTSQAYYTYSGWFANLPLKVKERIFRLNPSQLPLPGIKTLDEGGLSLIIKKIDKEKQVCWSKPLAPYPNHEERKNIIFSVIDRWLDYLKSWQINYCAKNKSPLFFTEPLLVKLSYFLNTQLLLEYKKTLRSNSPLETQRRAEILLEENRHFLSQLRNKI